MHTHTHIFIIVHYSENTIKTLPFATTTCVRLVILIFMSNVLQIMCCNFHKKILKQNLPLATVACETLAIIQIAARRWGEIEMRFKKGWHKIIQIFKKLFSNEKFMRNLQPPPQSFFPFHMAFADIVSTFLD